MATVFKKVANNAGSTLLNPILSTDLTLSVQSGLGASFPATAGGATYWITLSKADGSAYEIVLVTGLSADTFTVTRAQQGTSAQAWATGDRVDLFWIAQHLVDVHTAINTLEAAGGGSSSTNLATATAAEYEEFWSGTAANGAIGKWGWGLGAGTVNNPGPTANHPGLLQQSTGVTANTLARIFSTSGASGTIIDPSLLFDITWILRPDVLDAETMIRFGLVDSSSNNPPNGIFVERLVTDTNDFFGVCRVSSGATQTRTAVIPTATSASTPTLTAGTFYRVRIRRVNGTTIGFSVDGQAEQTVTTNIPTATLLICSQLYYNTGGTLGAKTLTHDAVGIAAMTVVR